MVFFPLVFSCELLTLRATNHVSSGDCHLVGQASMVGKRSHERLLSVKSIFIMWSGAKERLKRASSESDAYYESLHPRLHHDFDWPTYHFSNFVL